LATTCRFDTTAIEITPGEFRIFQASEIARWGKLVEMAGIAKK